MKAAPKPKRAGPVQGIRRKRTATAKKPLGTKATARPAPSSEAEETLNAILAGRIDALFIRGGDAERLYAIRSFSEIEETEEALKDAGAARNRADAQLRLLADERERLFQDLHDGCIQSIYAVGLNLEACLRLLEANPAQAGRMIGDATASLNLVIQELRAFIAGRRLEITGGGDLRSAIESATRAAADHSIAFCVDIDDKAMRSLTPDQALHLLQIAREGISNAVRHANARNGRVSLRKKGSRLYLEMSDDGSGLDGNRANKLGLGLHHIDARARKMGGKASVTSAPGKGTRIVVELPLAGRSR